MQENKDQKDETINVSLNPKYAAIAAGIVIIAVAAFLLYKPTYTGTATIPFAGFSNSPIPLGEEFPIEGRTHVPEGTKVDYHNSNPPTSGNHWPRPAEWGIYDKPLPDEVLVHNLEHGGIWISYKDVDEETKSKIKSIAEKYPRAVIVTPRPENDAKISIASWGRLIKMDSLDEGLVERFIRSNINKAPEPLASLEQPQIKVGSPFPDFEVTEVDGRSIIKNSLQGKPAIIWFTTSWCVPCQIGAKKVAKLDNELGGDAFNVLVIFVDPRETSDDLINWRDKFANPDWMVAFDNFEADELSPKVNLRYLDSKFLIDENGIIKDIDFAIADEDYLNKIRQVVEGTL